VPSAESKPPRAPKPPKLYGSTKAAKPAQQGNGGKPAKPAPPAFVPLTPEEFAEAIRLFAHERVDRVPKDDATSVFKQRARLHQARWREQRGFRIGSQPMVPKVGEPTRPLGSRLDLTFARRSKANFLSPRIAAIVEERLAHPQLDQTLDPQRLWGDLLSSMPMCFNLFGTLATDLGRATRALRLWWPCKQTMEGQVIALHFEWSPGRRRAGHFLENRSAFDVAFELRFPDGTRGILGVETKYHEDCRPEDPPTPERRERYKAVALASGHFRMDDIDSKIIVSPGQKPKSNLQQLWLDHLLALSIPQDKPDRGENPWSWAALLLVHPAQNWSYARAAQNYAKLLKRQENPDLETFRVATL